MVVLFLPPAYGQFTLILMEEEQLVIVENSDHASEQPAARSPFLKGLIGGIVGLVVLIFVVGVPLAYRFPDATPVMPAILDAVGAPVASLGGVWLSWHALSLDISAFKKQIDELPAGSLPQIPSNDEIRTRALQRMIALTAGEKVLAARGVTIKPEDLAAREQVIAVESGGKDKMIEIIKKDFGWTYEEYVDRVIRATVIADKLYKEPARTKIAEIKKSITEGADFSMLAKQFGQDGTAEKGGDLGFFERGKMVPEFEAVVFSLEKGKVSDPVETQFGYHLIVVDDIKKKKDGTVTAVKARHILIKYGSAETAAAVQQQVKDMKVRQFIYTEKNAKDGLDSEQATG